ncbi:hypothetical protein GOV11_03150 [Candidatus Woesearchaeota archaeon]|nr:hypothetical protein [Candidatus Woesearchaeota archaeon]
MERPSERTIKITLMSLAAVLIIASSVFLSMWLWGSSEENQGLKPLEKKDLPACEKVGGRCDVYCEDTEYNSRNICPANMPLCCVKL